MKKYTKHINESEDKMSTKNIYPGCLVCNGLENPVGISNSSILLEWKILGNGENVTQEMVEIEIYIENEEKNLFLYYSNIVAGKNQYIAIEKEFDPCKRYFWRVRIKTGGSVSGWTDWSEYSFFECAYGEKLFIDAEWIEADEKFYLEADSLCKKFWKKNKKLNFFAQTIPDKPDEYPPEDQGMRRCPYIRKSFEIQEPYDKARVYIAVHGFYKLFINKKKIGNYALAPDFTAYDKCIYYQTYDVTDFLKVGENELEIILADGWYVGHAQSIPGSNHIYGERPAFLLQLDVSHKSKKVLCMVSDETFEAWNGSILYADLFMGEYYDAYQRPQKYGTIVRKYDKSVLIPQEGEGVQEILTVAAVSVTKIEKNNYIIDFGQVLAGRERIRFLREKGSLIKIEHSEILKEDGIGDICNVIPDSFPFHDQTDYVKVDSDDFTYEPSFSFQGFRYLKISGTKNEICKENCEAAVLQTAMKDALSFQCSHSKINKLCENVLWSQRGNMISIPTDCPQRERAGFTGDAQIFCTTACWNQNVYTFFERWLKQCRLEQFEHGQIPITVPYTKGYSLGAPNPAWTSAGWGDAIIFVPWNLYQAYGKIKILKDNYDAMEKWMSYVKMCAEESMPERYYFDERRRWQKYLWNSGYHWGDWLMPGISAHEGVTLTKEITASLYYFREVSVMYEITKVLNLPERTQYYEVLRENIRKAFYMFYVTDGKKLTTDLQGMYAMALAFDIAYEEDKAVLAKRLNKLVIEKEYHLATGFLSTPYLLDVLWDNGYSETARRVLFQDTCPSWLYEVKKGATTVWECWNDKDENTGDIISSYNHYAYGTVCDFIYRKFSGIKKYTPGFEKIVIQPERIEEISYAEFKYDTPKGILKISWNTECKEAFYHLAIPHGMEAEIKLKDKNVLIGSGGYQFSLNRDTFELSM